MYSFGIIVVGSGYDGCINSMQSKHSHEELVENRGNHADIEDV